MIAGTLAVGIGQEENAAQPVLNYNVTTGSSIVIPQGDDNLTAASHSGYSTVTLTGRSARRLAALHEEYGLH